MKDIEPIIDVIPIGYSEKNIHGVKFGIRKSDFNKGKSIKVFAEELGGNEFISFNYYKTSTPYLKPCEMPENKVLDFLNAYSQVD